MALDMHDKKNKQTNKQTNKQNENKIRQLIPNVYQSVKDAPNQ